LERDQALALSETVASIKTVESASPILAVLAGAETGVELADRLSTALGTRSNGLASMGLRQSKFEAAMAVQKAGVRVPRQCRATNEEEVTAFWSEMTAAAGSQVRCVLKPENSIEGDSVTLCDSLESALKTFRKIYGQFNMLSRVNAGVLCMERVVNGTEYTIDTVSRNGESKVVAIWEIDKTAITPALSMVYGMRLRDLTHDPALMAALGGVTTAVLPALGIVHGPAHTKVIVDKGGVVFLTARASCQAGGASWLSVAKACVGYNILEMTLNAYLRPDQYDVIEKIPSKLLKEGMDVNLLSLHSGHVMAIPGLVPIRNLASVLSVSLFTQPGSEVVRTTNRMSRAGFVQLVAKEEEQLEADYIKLKEIQLSNMVFELQ
jgi:biotin carboxylase